MSLLFNTVCLCHSVPAKKQSPSDFMAAVTIRSDFRVKEEEGTTSTFSPSVCHEVMVPDATLLL
ncbi:hypothetical protein, partial [Holdemanella sp. DFI.5.21]|uniref:hypothetical protein n=1 Tax=Holdemanella sp. DFI.5.21 TaxID=2916964 RepID=UPI001EE912B2